MRLLPYYGPKHAAKKNDTSYHTVPDFNFFDQDGHPVNKSTVKDKIYVAEYFFTTCQSICPIMNDHLKVVDSVFRSRPDFMILSHTVDPEHDSVEVLKEYAAAKGIRDKKWLFVTGKKSELYSLARKGYLLNAEEGNGGAEDFIHTQNFALVDMEQRLRGFYDGTDSTDVSRMITDIRLLLKEYDHKKTLD